MISISEVNIAIIIIPSITFTITIMVTTTITTTTITIITSSLSPILNNSKYTASIRRLQFLTTPFNELKRMNTQVVQYEIKFQSNQ